MKTQKGFTLIDLAIYIVLTSILCLVIIQLGHKTNLKQTAKVSTYTDRQIYIDLKTLEPSKNQPTTSNILRIEFLGIEGDNNWVEIIGDVPETYPDRLDTAKAIAVLKGIVTKEELLLFSTQSIQEIGSTRIVKLKK